LPKCAQANAAGGCGSPVRCPAPTGWRTEERRLLTKPGLQPYSLAAPGVTLSQRSSTPLPLATHPASQRERCSCPR
jgi:hypothetical protein